MKENAGKILLFGSTDDPFLPWTEQYEVIIIIIVIVSKPTRQSFMTSKVATNLDAELHKYEDRGHFMDPKFPELIKAVKDIANA